VDWQVGEGSSGLVTCGTTGEVATLTAEEHAAVVRATVEAARGRVPVIAGCGSYSTAESLRKMQTARELGADAALVVVPGLAMGWFFLFNRLKN
jgi:4-hydroxy-tetrahydrodipicolinate synthase